MALHNGRRNTVHNASAAVEAAGGTTAVAARRRRRRRRRRRMWWWGGGGSGLLGDGGSASGPRRSAAFRCEQAEEMAESAERRWEQNCGGERPGGAGRTVLAGLGG